MKLEGPVYTTVPVPSHSVAGDRILRSTEGSVLCASVRIIRYCIGAVMILLTRSPTAGSESDQVPLLSGSVVPAVEWVKVRAEWPGLMVMVAAQLVNVSVEYKSREGEGGTYLMWVALRVMEKPVTEALVALCWRRSSSAASAATGVAEATLAKTVTRPVKAVVNFMLS